MKPLRSALRTGTAIALVAVFVWLVHAWLDRSGSGAIPWRSVGGTPRALRWQVGTSQRYAVRTDSTLRMNTIAAGATRPGQSIRVQLGGTLEFYTLEVGPSQVLAGMQLSSVSLRISGASDAATDRVLATPFRVRFALDGLPMTFEFPSGLAQEHRGVLENLVRTFQTVVRDEANWTSEEPGASGPYEADYRREGTGLLKTKRRFLAPASSTDADAAISSRESIRIDPARDWIATMTVDETVRSGGPTGLTVHVTNHASLELEAEAVVRSPAALQAWRFAASAATESGSAAAAATPPLNRAETEQRIRLDLAGLDAARTGRHAWIHRLRDLVRGDGQLPFTLLEAMRQRTLSDRTRADVFLALELAGSPRAQAALQSVLEGDRWAMADRKRAVIALGGVATPTTETLDTLRRLSQSKDPSRGGSPLEGTATLALGSVGARLASARDERYPALRAELLDGANAGHAARQRVDFVHALGNTGDTSLVPQIVPMLGDDTPAVRAASAHSLGRLGTDQAADALLARLRQEPVDVVRGAIATALTSWSVPTPAAMAALRATLASEREESTRLAMAQILGKNLDADPENRAALQALLRAERSERIRREVAQMLAPGR